MEDIVSIITPCYNCEQFIAQTIESVFAQTYQKWEMMIIDDCSTDGSIEIIKKYYLRDARIKLFKTEHNSGSPVSPRNIGVQCAQGRYIAFLDSDDIWLPDKLEAQIKLFGRGYTAIVYSYYEKISENGIRCKRIIKSPKETTYNKLLKGNCIGCSTAMYDTIKVGKHYFLPVQNEDYAYWLSILKKGFVARNTNTVEVLYRIRNNSVSTNKLTAAKWTWNIYRKTLKLSFIQSVCYYCLYMVKAIGKYIK
jgi:glycosyltransferase involved in cell wall biosynthesis